MTAYSDVNPDVLGDAPDARVERLQLEAIHLHVEIGGSRDPVLIVGAADEDAEIHRGIAVSHGTASLPIFGEIARKLAGFRDDEPDALTGVGHNIFYHPEVAVDYIRRWI